MPISVLLAEDHQLVRQGIVSLLAQEGMEVVGEAADGHEALRLAMTRRPDVAVLDLSMPLLNGLEVARRLVSTTKTRTILLTRHGDDSHVVEALRVGVRGYVMKNQGASDLVQAIREVHRGSFYLCPNVSGTVIDAFLTRSAFPDDPLTSRERQVLQLICESKSTKEIGVALSISTKTAESHRTRMMQKLNIHAVVGLVRYAIRRGMVDP